MACLNANSLEPGGDKVLVQPFRERAVLKAHHINLIVPKPKLLDQRPRFAINLTLPDDLTVMVEHADSSFLQRNIKANELAHGLLRSSDGRLQA